MKTREYTNKIIELVDEGLINRDELIRDLLNWLSEAEVEDFWDQNLSEDFETFEEIED